MLQIFAYRIYEVLSRHRQCCLYLFCVWFHIVRKNLFDWWCESIFTARFGWGLKRGERSSQSGYVLYKLKPFSYSSSFSLPLSPIIFLKVVTSDSTRPCVEWYSSLSFIANKSRLSFKTSLFYLSRNSFWTKKMDSVKNGDSISLYSSELTL